MTPLAGRVHGSLGELRASPDGTPFLERADGVAEQFARTLFVQDLGGMVVGRHLVILHCVADAVKVRAVLMP
ncbi:hypothetical protein T8K17_06980 [Thalassobaculum sp. OXR-137]|uniref:hypothetical protein n=1 Tax=Thalassobaculum sp. OXR-137 TaxID=3100173 RepID=UPI002AC99D1D|nr:hypothetical protein [Thalassobaculum sp. OXR-137]WPZ35876.1 hypothetical protein T8K17_06980 [Thalassobaculum sp. OXR-137]